MASAFGIGLLFHYLSREPEVQGRSLSAWASDLRSGQPSHRQRAQQVFREHPQAVQFLTERIAADAGPLQRAAELAARHLPEKLKRGFRRLFNPGRSVLEKHLAIQVLQNLGTNAQPAIPALAKLLRDPNVLLSGSAGMALGNLGSPAVPTLVEALDHPDFNVRSSACSALALLSSNAAPAVPRLVAIIENEPGAIVSFAAYALSQIRAPAVPALIPLLDSTNAVTRRWAAFALGQMGTHAADAIPKLILIARDDELPVRAAALDALARIGRTSLPANEALLAALDDSEAAIRGIAMTALTTRPSVVRRYATRIEKSLQDQSPLVRSNAVRALELIRQ